MLLKSSYFSVRIRAPEYVDVGGYVNVEFDHQILSPRFAVMLGTFDAIKSMSSVFTREKSFKLAELIFLESILLSAGNCVLHLA